MSKFYNAFGELVTIDSNIETFTNGIVIQEGEFQPEELNQEELELELELKNSNDNKGAGVLEDIQLFKKQLEEGLITKEQVMKKMDKYNDLYRLKKLSKAEEQALRDLEKSTIRKVDGIGLRGNLELGGVIKAKGFYLQDGSKVNEVIKKEKIYAIPLDKQGNISLKPKKDSKVNVESNMDIATEKRTGDLPTKQPALYVTGKSGSGSYGDNSIAEFRHTNQRQGMGIGYNTIYAAGSDPNQDVNIKPKGTGDIKLHGRTRLGENASKTGELWINNAKNSNNTSGWATHFNYQNKGLNYIRGDTEIRGEANFADNKKGINISNPKNSNNSSGGGTHFNYKGKGENYIRGKTEMKGEVNFRDVTKGINIEGKQGWSHFNYQGRGDNYIRGKTEMNGETNFVNRSKGINIWNAKNGNNPTGWGSHFNYQGKAENYLRGKTELRGEVNFRDANKGINIEGRQGWSHFNYQGKGDNYIRGKTEMRGEVNFRDANKGINIEGKQGWSHFNYQGKGLNYIRGQTEIRGNQVNVISNSGVRVHGHGKLSSFGSLNSGWCHLITNAPQFYMNKSLQINGGISSYFNKPLNCNRGIISNGVNNLRGNTRIQGNLHVDKIRIGNYLIESGRTHLMFKSLQTGKTLLSLNPKGSMTAYTYGGRGGSHLNNTLGWCNDRQYRCPR